MGGVPLDTRTNRSLAASLAAAARVAPDSATVSLIKSLATRAMSEAQYFSTGAPLGLTVCLEETIHVAFLAQFGTPFACLSVCWHRGEQKHLRYQVRSLLEMQATSCGAAQAPATSGLRSSTTHTLPLPSGATQIWCADLFALNCFCQNVAQRILPS